MTVSNAPRAAGRPKRSPLEVARTAAWFEFVRIISGWTGSRLEKHFDERDQAARDRHRGTRWNKYKFGRTSPARSLLERVDQRFPKTLAAYDHVVWDLAGTPSTSAGDLRAMAGRLPQEVSTLFLDPQASATSPFWLRQDFNHRSVIVAVCDLFDARQIGHFEVVAALLTVAHDALLRQLERQHFETYIAIAHKARGYALGPGVPLAWRLEAFIFGSWLKTEYRDPEIREKMALLRSVEEGPHPPWLQQQRPLAFAREKPRLDQRGEEERKAFWAACKLIDLFPAGD
ncbi:hypothetical protein [Roseateles violae]|uniref:Uncharacterized protein n=1 Tax=Roseateles violae TaxID=3058042 RepID=A0ABT8DWC0_9BURK|nr:hypothetical protein [Pelomonas sp. PFR6]MDN3922557.1 hypothetical protein [Pelomonas sp. PFR6]